MKRLLTILVGVILATASLSAQDARFSSHLKTATKQYEGGKYNEALSTIRIALDRFLPDEAQKAEAEALRKKCQSQLSRFEVGTDVVSLPWQSCVDSIAVFTGNPKGVSVISDSPTWCNVEFQDKYIRVYVTENVTHIDRRAIITASLGRSKKSVVVNQVAKPEVNKWVMIQTSPSGANVTIDDGFVSSVPVLNKILGGRKHRFVCTKNSYQTKDTSIFIPDSNVGDTLKIMIPLKPEFTKLKMSLVNPENGEINDPHLQIRVNDRLLAWESELEDPKNYTYDDTKKVQLYHVYSDGTVPVDPGVSQITMKAKGFHDFKIWTPQLDAGEEYPVDLRPRPRTGTLQVIRLDDGYYAGAKGSHIILDGKYDLGILKDTLTKEIIIGHHTLEAKKKGFYSLDNVEIEIKENDPAEWLPLIFPFVNYSFSSYPDSAVISVNGKRLDTPTPYVYQRGATMGIGSFDVVVEKPGYSPVRHAFKPDFTVPDSTFYYEFQLHPSKQIRIKTKWGKKEDYFLTVRGKKVNGVYPADSVFYKRQQLPTVISLTPRSAPYTISISNKKGKEVYSHSFKYGGQEKDSIKTAHLFNSTYHATIIRANYFYIPNRQYFTIGESPSNDFSPVGSIAVGDFSFGYKTGLSTSVVRSTVFLEREKNRELGIDGKTLQERFPLIPAISVVSNLDFRIGGIVANAFRTNVLASFAYYPNFSNMLSIDTISGFDIFLGLELSSLIPVFNVNVRAGYQMYRGMKANIFMGNLTNSGIDQVVSRDFSIPNMFVISLGFSLGTGTGETACTLFKPF